MRAVDGNGLKKDALVFLRLRVIGVSGVLLICYDLIFLPIEAFQPESSLFMEIMAWVSSCYWLLDIPLSFLVGYPLLEESF